MNPPPTEIQTTQVKRLVAAVLRYLGIRDRSRGEILTYLKRKRPPVDQLIIDQVLEKVSHFNLLNDDNFAVHYALVELSRGKGPRWIAAALRQKGLESGTIDLALKSLDPAAVLDSAGKLVLKKIALWQGLDSRTRYAKVAALLQRRGFSGSVAHTVIDELPPPTVK